VFRSCALDKAGHIVSFCAHVNISFRIVSYCTRVPNKQPNGYPGCKLPVYGSPTRDLCLLCSVLYILCYYLLFFCYL